MEKQETIKEEKSDSFSIGVVSFRKASHIFMNLLFAIMFMAIYICTIALLYVNGFVGVSIILYNLLKYFILAGVLLTLVYYYLLLMENLFKQARIKRAERMEILKQQLKQEILRDLRYGRGK